MAAQRRRKEGSLGSSRARRVYWVFMHAETHRVYWVFMHAETHRVYWVFMLVGYTGSSCMQRLIIGGRGGSKGDAGDSCVHALFTHNDDTDDNDDAVDNDDADDNDDIDDNDDTGY